MKTVAETWLDKQKSTAIRYATAATVMALSLLILLQLAGAASADPDRWMRQGWKGTDFSKTSIDFSEVLSGGPPKDGIPSIDQPSFRPASQIETLGEKEPVIRLEVNGELKGYPLQVLTWHEIVNDTIGGMPVAVTYCPLCNAAIVFERRVDGEPTTFGTTGKLRNSDLIMYDRKTESWWQQFTGEAIVGSQVGSALKMVPARVVSFSAFLAEAPDAKVLVPNNPRMRDYGRNPYAGYDSSRRPFLYSGEMPDGIAPMVRVIVVKGDESKKPMAVSMALLRQKGEMMLGDVTVTWTHGVNSALDKSRIADGRDVGSIRTTMKAADGSARDVVHDVTFAFAFHAFHPDVKIMIE